MRLSNAVSYTAFFIASYALTAGVFYMAWTTEYHPVDDFSLVRLVILLLFAPIIVKYVFHLFIVPWYPAVEAFRSRRRPRDFNPMVSVLIPAWNEEIGIRHTIESVLRSSYPRFEVIVVNDGSTDRTHEIVTNCIRRYLRRDRRVRHVIKYERTENRGKAAALNRALARAEGDIIITIDSDSVMDVRTIGNMVKHFTDARVASVAGNVVVANRSRLISLIQQLEYVYGFYFKRADSLLNAVYIVGGAAAAYRKTVLDQIGGFDERAITEDIELSTRIQFHGHQVRYAADAIVYTEAPSDFTGLFRQRLRWKYGRLMTFYKYHDFFFSAKKGHNVYLTFFILPIALFAEILLFFEGALLMAFYTYTVLTNDYAPLALVISILAVVVMFQVATDPFVKYHRNLFLLAPIAWILFYFMDMVEYQALIRSIRRVIVRENVEWQRWVRKGLPARFETRQVSRN